MTASLSPGPKQAELVRLHTSAIQDDAKAMDQLLGRLYPIVRNFLRRRVNGAQNCEALLDDLVQEAMLKVVESIRKCTFSEDRSLVAWTLTVARNAAIDNLRRAAKRRSAMLLAAEIASLPQAEFEQARPTELLPEARATLNYILDRLEPETHSLLWSRIVENSTWGDVALELGITVSGAKRRWQRLRGRLEVVLVSQVISDRRRKPAPLAAE
jgi:RNA polymerase sigma factor (sigma-70 family)